MLANLGKLLEKLIKYGPLIFTVYDGAEKRLGVICLKCGKRSFFHQEEGETFWSGKKKYRCDGCGKSFKVSKPS